MMNIEVITPEDIVFKGVVKSVIAPGVDGLFGILKDHAPLLSALGDGKVKLELEDSSLKEFQVSGGFLEVGENNITLLADKVL